MAAEQVDLASVPFATFIANKKQSGDPASYSFVLRGYVRHWLDNVWAEYDRVGLTDIVDAKILGANQEVLGAPLKIARAVAAPGPPAPGLHVADEASAPVANCAQRGPRNGPALTTQRVMNDKTTPLYVVCSPCRGVGKTLVSRLLTEFYVLDDRPVAAFDLADEGPQLADYLPAIHDDCRHRRHLAARWHFSTG